MCLCVFVKGRGLSVILNNHYKSHFVQEPCCNLDLNEQQWPIAVQQY